MPRPLGLADLAVRPRPGGGTPEAVEGPTERVTAPVGFEDTIACVQNGLYLAHDGEQRVAVFVRGADDFGNPFARKVRVEVMAETDDAAAKVLGQLRGWVREGSVHRGKVFSLEFRMPTGVVDVRFHRIPAIERDEMCCRPACSSGSNGTPSVRASRRHVCAGLAATSAGGFCCTAHRARARRPR